MNILCLNTAFSKADIAFSFEGKNYFTSIDSNAKHSENLLIEIEKLLSKACKENINTSDLLNKVDVISVVIGPGSFTGLRIGIATVKAFKVTHEHMNIVTLNSLELIANSSKNTRKTPIMDALSGYYFISRFENEKCVEEPKMIKQEELGNYKNFVSFEKLSFETEIINLSPEKLLNLTLSKIQKKQYTLEENLLPLYIRPSQAEANFNDNKQNNKKWFKWNL